MSVEKTTKVEEVCRAGRGLGWPEAVSWGARDVSAGCSMPAPPCMFYLICSGRSSTLALTSPRKWPFPVKKRGPREGCWGWGAGRQGRQATCFSCRVFKGSWDLRRWLTGNFCFYPFPYPSAWPCHPCVLPPATSQIHFILVQGSSRRKGVCGCRRQPFRDSLPVPTRLCYPHSAFTVSFSLLSEGKSDQVFVLLLSGM